MRFFANFYLQLFAGISQPLLNEDLSKKLQFDVWVISVVCCRKEIISQWNFRNPKMEHYKIITFGHFFNVASKHHVGTSFIITFDTLSVRLSSWNLAGSVMKMQHDWRLQSESARKDALRLNEHLKVEDYKAHLVLYLFSKEYYTTQ